MEARRFERANSFCTLKLFRDRQPKSSGGNRDHAERSPDTGCRGGFCIVFEHEPHGVLDPCARRRSARSSGGPFRSVISRSVKREQRLRLRYLPMVGGYLRSSQTAAREYRGGAAWAREPSSGRRLGQRCSITFDLRMDRVAAKLKCQH